MSARLKEGDVPEAANPWWLPVPGDRVCRGPGRLATARGRQTIRRKWGRQAALTGAACRLDIAAVPALSMSLEEGWTGLDSAETDFLLFSMKKQSWLAF